MDSAERLDIDKQTSRRKRERNCQIDLLIDCERENRKRWKKEQRRMMERCITIKQDVNGYTHKHKHIHDHVCKMLLLVSNNDYVQRLTGGQIKWLIWPLYFSFCIQKVWRPYKAIYWQICIKAKRGKWTMTLSAQYIQNMQIYLTDECVKGPVRSIAFIDDYEYYYKPTILTSVIIICNIDLFESIYMYECTFFIQTWTFVYR